MGGCASTQLDHRYDCSFYIIQGAEALAQRRVPLAVKKFAEARRQLPHFELLQESSTTTTTASTSTAAPTAVLSAPTDHHHQGGGGAGVRNPLKAGFNNDTTSPSSTTTKPNKNSTKLRRRPSQPNIVAQNFFTGGGSDGNVSMGPPTPDILKIGGGSGQKQFSSDDDEKDAKNVDPDAGLTQEEVEHRKVEKELRSALRAVRRESLGYGNLMVGVDMFDLAMLAGELPPSEFQSDRADNNEDGYYQNKRHNHANHPRNNNNTNTNAAAANTNTTTSTTDMAKGNTSNTSYLSNTTDTAVDINSSSQLGAPRGVFPFQASPSGTQSLLHQSTGEAATAATSSSNGAYSVHSQKSTSMLAPQESMAMKSTSPTTITSPSQKQQQQHRMATMPPIPGFDEVDGSTSGGGAAVLAAANGTSVVVGGGGDVSSGGVMSISDGDECIPMTNNNTTTATINPHLTNHPITTPPSSVSKDVDNNNTTNNNGIGTDVVEFATDTDFSGGGNNNNTLTRTSSILVNKSKHSYHGEYEDFQRNATTPPLIAPSKNVKWDAVDSGTDDDDDDQQQQLKSGGGGGSVDNGSSTPRQGMDAIITPSALRRKAGGGSGKRQSVVDFDLGGGSASLGVAAPGDGGGGGTTASLSAFTNNNNNASTSNSGTHRTPQWQRDRDTLRLDFSSRFGTFGLGNQESAFFEPPPPEVPSPKNALSVRGGGGGAVDNAEFSVRDASIMTLSCNSGTNQQQHSDHEDSSILHQNHHLDIGHGRGNNSKLQISRDSDDPSYASIHHQVPPYSPNTKPPPQSNPHQHAAPVPPATRLLTAASTLSLFNTTDPMVLSKLGDVLNAMLVIADHFLSWGHIALAERNYLIVSGVAFILGRSARHKQQYIVILYKRLRDRANLGVSWSLLERGRRMHRNTKHSRNTRMSLFAVALQHSVAVRVNQEGNPEVVAELMRGQYNSSLQARINYLDPTKKRTGSKNARGGGGSKDNGNELVLQDERAAYEVFHADDRSSSDSSSESEKDEEKPKLKKLPSILVNKPPPATTTVTTDVSSGGDRNNSNTSSSSYGATTHTATATTDDSSTSLVTPTKVPPSSSRNNDDDVVLGGGTGPFIYGAVPWGVWTWEDEAQQELYRAAAATNNHTHINNINLNLPMRRYADKNHKISFKAQPTSRSNTNIKKGKKKLKADFLSGKAMTLTNTAEATSDVLLPDGARLWLGEPLIDALVLEACTRLEMVLESYNDDRAAAAANMMATVNAAAAVAKKSQQHQQPVSPGTIQISVPSTDRRNDNNATDSAPHQPPNFPPLSPTDEAESTAALLPLPTTCVGGDMAGSLDTLVATTPIMNATTTATTTSPSFNKFSLSTHHHRTDSPPRSPPPIGGIAAAALDEDHNQQHNPPGTNEDASLIILKVQKALGLVAMKLGVHSVEYAKVGSLLEACRTALQWNTRDRHRLNRPKQPAPSPLDDSQQGMGATSAPQNQYQQHHHVSPGAGGGRRQRARSVVQILEDAWAANNNDDDDGVKPKPLNQFVALADSTFGEGGSGKKSSHQHVNPPESRSGTLKASDGGETSFFGSFSEGAGSRS